MASVPINYFSLRRPSFSFHLKDFNLVSSYCPIILGGGGIIWADGTEPLGDRKSKKIIWGAGVNRDWLKSNDYYPDYIKKFDLVGVRDWGTAYDWVPCCSCMSDLFNQQWDVKHEIVAYLHGEIKDLGQIPQKSCLGCSLEEAISFIASGEVIVSSSYHGMYWATLLNKKVIVVPHNQSSRFYFSRYNFPISDDWRTVDIKSIPNYPQALEQCREANISFWYKVKTLLEKEIKCITLI